MNFKDSNEVVRGMNDAGRGIEHRSQGADYDYGYDLEKQMEAIFDAQTTQQEAELYGVQL